MGGSESRFIIGSAEDWSCAKQPTAWITQKDTNWNDRTVTSLRDPDNRYQKVIFKQDGSFFNIRFDNFPQPCWGAHHPELRMTEANGSATQWQPLFFDKRKTGTQRWGFFDGKIDWDNMKEHELRIMILHPSTRSFLGNVSGLPVLVPLPDNVTYDHNYPDPVVEYLHNSSMQSTWIVQCVDHNLSMEETMLAVVGPIALPGAVKAMLL